MREKRVDASSTEYREVGECWWERQREREKSRWRKKGRVEEEADEGRVCMGCMYVLLTVQGE